MTKLPAWLIALRAPGLGRSKVLDWLDAGKPIEELVKESRSGMRALGFAGESIEALRNPDGEALARDQDWLAGENRQLVTWDHDLYPPLLRRIADPPIALFVEGEAASLWHPQIAVVGSRNPTAGGLDHAQAFAAELCQQGFAIASGLASGIDSAAHRAALDTGGLTVAVTGTGPDLVYPASSARLAAEISQSGVLVSEFPTGVRARRSHFPSRNRIISGLSMGVLVIEAGLQSGSLITARLAGEQGREVFALPGSLHNPMVRGCHRLIKQGARLVESVQDIVDEVAPMAQELAGELRIRLADPAPHPSPDPQVEAPDSLVDDPEYQRLWQAIGFDPVSIESLVEKCNLEVREVSSMLLMLELRGLVEKQPGGRVSRCGNSSGSASQARVS